MKLVMGCEVYFMIAQNCTIGATPRPPDPSSSHPIETRPLNVEARAFKLRVLIFYLD